MQILHTMRVIEREKNAQRGSSFSMFSMMMLCATAGSRAFQADGFLKFSFLSVGPTTCDRGAKRFPAFSELKIHRSQSTFLTGNQNRSFGCHAFVFFFLC